MNSGRVTFEHKVRGLNRSQYGLAQKTPPRAFIHTQARHTHTHKRSFYSLEIPCNVEFEKVDLTCEGN